MSDDTPGPSAYVANLQVGARHSSILFNVARLWLCMSENERLEVLEQMILNAHHATANGLAGPEVIDSDRILDIASDLRAALNRQP